MLMDKSGQIRGISSQNARTCFAVVGEFRESRDGCKKFTALIIVGKFLLLAT